MIEKIIVWFRNNWFLWVVLIAGYIVIRAFGYDIKVVDLNRINSMIRSTELD